MLVTTIIHIRNSSPAHRLCIEHLTTFDILTVITATAQENFWDITFYNLLSCIIIYKDLTHRKSIPLLSDRRQLFNEEFSCVQISSESSEVDGLILDLVEILIDIDRVVIEKAGFNLCCSKSSSYVIYFNHLVFQTACSMPCEEKGWVQTMIVSIKVIRVIIFHSVGLYLVWILQLLNLIF